MSCHVKGSVKVEVTISSTVTTELLGPVVIGVQLISVIERAATIVLGATTIVLVVVLVTE